MTLLLNMVWRMEEKVQTWGMVAKGAEEALIGSPSDSEMLAALSDAGGGSGRYGGGGSTEAGGGQSGGGLGVG